MRRIERWARARGAAVELVGIDLNPYAARAAKEFTPPGSAIEWITGDAFSYDRPIDVVVSSLFTHHLAGAEIVRFLGWSESVARCGWFVNDLARETMPFHLFGALATVMGWHRFVKHDGPVSFRRSFREEDWSRMLGRGRGAGCVDATLDAGAAVCRADEVRLLIIGGGLAGSAAAITAARAGCEVTLVEREAKPHDKVCGEFLSREALHYLDLLGVDVASLGAVPICKVRLGGGAEAGLPFAAMSMTRRRLDEELLVAAEAAGAKVLRGCRVEGLERVDGGWSASTGAMNLRADDMFLATGKHDLRGRPRPKGRQSDLFAFKMYWRLRPDQAAAMDGCVELLLYRGGYAGLQPVEDGAANLSCLIQRREFQRLGGWEQLLAAMQAESPLLRRRLEGARPLLDRPLAVAPIPYGYVRRAEPSTEGVWFLGDQAAVIPSFTGDGMSIALHSGCMAAAMYLRGGTAEQFQRRLQRQVRGQVGLATLISRGLVWRPSRVAMLLAVRLWPGWLGAVARRTRVSAEAMRSNAFPSPPYQPK